MLFGSYHFIWHFLVTNFQHWPIPIYNNRSQGIYSSCQSDSLAYIQLLLPWFCLFRLLFVFPANEFSAGFCVSATLCELTAAEAATCRRSLAQCNSHFNFSKLLANTFGASRFVCSSYVRPTIRLFITAKSLGKSKWNCSICFLIACGFSLVELMKLNWSNRLKISNLSGWLTTFH